MGPSLLQGDERGGQEQRGAGGAGAGAGVPVGAGRASWLCSRVRWRNQVLLHMAIPAACIIAAVQVVVNLPRMFLGLVFPVFNVL